MAHILVVADEPWVVNEVRAALEGEYDLTVLADPRDTVGSFEELSPAAVVVDLQVGSMGGMAVTRALRDAASVAGRELPAVVVMLDRAADSFLAGRSGASAWVRKPFTAHELRSALDGVMAPAADGSR